MTIFGYLISRVREAVARCKAFWNRWTKHYDLAVEYRFADDPEDKFIIVQRMMMRDREEYRRSSSDSNRPYPIVWDYYIPPGRIGWQMASRAKSDREAELRELRQRLRPSRR